MTSPSTSPQLPSSQSSRVIAHERVLRYVYEFLDENGYQQSLRALQAESKVPYNTIHVKTDATVPAPPSLSGKRGNAKGFAPATECGLEGAVMEGSWAEVLHVYVDGLLLPEEIKANLYEVILEEMVELHGLVPAARSLLLNAPIFQLMRTDTPARYIRLEKMIENGQRTVSEGTAGIAATRHVTPEMRQRRTALLQQLKTAIRFIAEAPVGRLPAALARAAGGWSGAVPQHPGAALQLGHTAPSMQEALAGAHAAGGRKREREPALPGDAAWADTFLQYPLTAPKEVQRRLPYTGERAASCCAPLPRGEAALLLVGCADGAVDFVDAATGETAGASLRHTDGVLCMTRDAVVADGGQPSPAADWLAVGYRDGWVKVYNLESHKLVRRFEKAHTMGVTALFFDGPRGTAALSGHHTLLITGSFDGALRVLDIAAGAVVQTVTNSHASAFVHALLPFDSRRTATAGLRDCFLSSGNDGTLAVWRLEDRRGEAEDEAGTVEVARVQDAVPLARVHQELRDAVPTQLHLLPALEDAVHGVGTADPAPEAAAGTAVTTLEALVLSRAGRACVLRVTVRDEGSRYFAVSWQALCLIVTAHPLRSAYAHVHPVVSMSVPLLTLYATDSEGTLSLHNIEMKWRSAEQWAEFGGCMRVNSAADQSAVIIVEVGKSVKDVHLTCLWPPSKHQPSSVVAYGPSLPAAYTMHY